jgi:16S rRNA (guanine966-N2)-methyltransferase
MRVIGGVAGGIPLFSPRSGNVRPTMDQVRAAIFSSLAERVAGARVLDLFAGTGGLGIEALSRGAVSTTFVERDRAAAEAIHRNLEKTKLAASGKVSAQDVSAFLQRLGRETTLPCFDLIFADPPYTTREQPIDFCLQITTSRALRAALAPEGLLILEKSPRHLLTLDSSVWEITRQKQYGSTEVLFLRAAPQKPPTSDGIFR